MGTGEKVQFHRHDWVIAPHRRPYGPVVYGTHGAKTEEKEILRMLIFFLPRMNDVIDATSQAISDISASQA